MRSNSEQTTPKPLNMIPTLAATLAKPILDVFITPKLQELEKAASKYFLTYTHDHWKHQFIEYIKASYIKNSSISTIAFNNQQRQLNELYIPLSIINKRDDSEYIINGYDITLLPVYEKILITDTAGMGKSTLLKKIFLSIIDQAQGLPMLIELRRINKDKDIIEEIIEQLSPINKSISRDFALDLIARGDFIFLFDGFDEIALDDKSFVIDNLQSFIAKANKNLFILTSRPESSIVSFGDFIEFSIKPLELDEAYELLRKYDNYGKLSEILINKVNENLSNLREFLTNPLLVSLLYTAFEHKQTIPLKKSAFYRQVFDALFELHDLSKGESFNRDKIRNCKQMTSDDFHQVLRAISFLCLKNQLRTEYTKDEILEIIRNAKGFCTGLQFDESGFLNDITKSTPLFARDGIYYKWAHKSIMEYFIAQFIFLDSKEYKAKYLKVLQDQYYEKFYNILDIYYTIDPKGFRDILVMNFLNDFLTFCDNTPLIESIPEEEINIRNSALFLYKIYVIHDNQFSKKKTPIDDKFIEKVFTYPVSLDNDHTKNWGLTSNSFRQKDKFGTLFQPKKYSYLFRFLLDKGTPPYKYVINEKNKYNLNLKFNRNFAALINSDKEAFFNKSENFSEINKLILRSLMREILLDKNEVVKYIEYIKSEQEEESKLFF